MAQTNNHKCYIDLKRVNHIELQIAIRPTWQPIQVNPIKISAVSEKQRNRFYKGMFDKLEQLKSRIQ
jgi:hypothetical protein